MRQRVGMSGNRPRRGKKDLLCKHGCRRPKTRHGRPRRSGGRPGFKKPEGHRRPGQQENSYCRQRRTEGISKGKTAGAEKQQGDSDQIRHGVSSRLHECQGYPWNAQQRARNLRCMAGDIRRLFSAKIRERKHRLSRLRPCVREKCRSRRRGICRNTKPSTRWAR